MPRTSTARLPHRSWTVVLLVLCTMLSCSLCGWRTLRPFVAAPLPAASNAVPPLQATHPQPLPTIGRSTATVVEAASEPPTDAPLPTPVPSPPHVEQHDVVPVLAGHPTEDPAVRRWEHARLVDEVVRLRGLLRDAADWQLRENVRSRGGSSRRDIDCRCFAFSAMDRHPSWCGPADDGTLISNAHACIVRDVCIDSDAKLHFLSDLDSPNDHFSFHESQQFGVFVGSREYPASVLHGAERDLAAPFFEAGRRGNVGPHDRYTTLVLLGHTTDNHITHWLEPLGSLQLAAKFFMRSRSDCAVDDLACFPPPDMVLSMQVSVPSASWQDHILRVALQDFSRRLRVEEWSEFKRHFPRVTRGTWGQFQMQCFDKAVIPRSFYGIWPRGVSTESFHSDLVKYVDTRDGGSSDPSRKRTVLLAKRTTKRAIVDWDHFEQIVRAAAATVGAEVDVIQFGSVPFEAQARAARSASILISLHGADLTNMLFQLPGSAVIEVNPLWFFENRFFELAQAMGLKYFAWTCTTVDCGFGGLRPFFEQVLSVPLAELGPEAPLGTFSTAKDGTFSWPWKGYAGSSCPPCDHLACCGVLAPVYYTKLRESDVRIGDPGGRHAEEFLSVLKDAFRALGWEPSKKGKHRADKEDAASGRSKYRELILSHGIRKFDRSPREVRHHRRA